MDKSDRSILIMKIVTWVACILVFITVFVVAWNMIDIDKVVLEEDEVDITKLAQKSMTASILQIDFDKKLVKLYNFEKNIAYEDEFSLSNQTKYLDKDNKLIGKEEFCPGVIVDLSYTEESNIISKMSLSKKSWTKKDVKDFKFDYLKNDMEINNVNYILDKEYTLTYKDGKASYKDLSEGNVVIKVTGYDKTVLGIDITYYLGKINLTYPDTLQGAVVQLGDKKILKIEEVNDTYLDPGDYKLVITKKGVDDIILDAKVEEDKVTNVDTFDVKVKSTLVNIIINVTDFTISVKSNDGNVNKTYTDNLSISQNSDLLSSNTMNLPYGIYTLTFSKEGYKSITKKVELNSDTKTVNVTMLTSSEAEQQISTDKYKITIQTDPSDAEIYIDGEHRSDGKLTVRLTPGMHEVRIEKNGYKGVTRQIEVTEDKEYKFVITNDNAFESPTGEVVD